MPISAEAPTLTGSWRVDPQASHARFVAGNLGGLRTTAGRFRSVSGQLVVDNGQVVGALEIDGSSIDTGNRFRDFHLRSRAFFDVKRHPRLRFEARSISGQDQRGVLIDGELIIGNTRTPLTLDVSLHAPAVGVVELACRTEVDRLALGIRGSRGIVPRTVGLDVAVTLRQTGK